MPDQPKTIREHLEELRWRLLVSVLTLVATTTLIFFVAEDWLFPMLERPAPDHITFLSTEPTGVFGPFIRVSLTAGAILAMPMFVYQLLMFVSPALGSNEKRYIYVLLPGALIAFAGGVAFSYFILLPPALNFLLTFGKDIAEIKPALGSYVGLVTTLMFWTGVLFETPILLYFLARIGMVTPSFLARNRRLAVLGAFLLGAVITPTLDPINQAMVAAPLVVLYELGIWLARLAAYQRRRAAVVAAVVEQRGTG